MSDPRVLVANRGEIALRVLQSAHDLNINAVSIYCKSDRFASHVLFSKGDSVEISGQGIAAYLNVPAILSAAQEFDCNLIHPGYGFLSESADFAEQVEKAGITWIGPTVSQL
ncbi:MAG: acetyl-CoA carboxylase biotin carboxylase subunit, partial [Acidiferrobacteraceae bacterium]|nr:acetyl-CoA carboxylase biotin carboxylase subunit [Acidiferrobacteraceae bacterium]